jgi:pyruvate,water dikinase
LRKRDPNEGTAAPSKAIREEQPFLAGRPFVVHLADVGSSDVGIVGGKNSSLGELIRNLASLRIKVPDGFATTAQAYWHFIDSNRLRPKIAACLADLRTGVKPLEETGEAIRRLILAGEIPADLRREINDTYAALCRRTGAKQLDVAVRSSATAEDLPGASFAGQLETFLNIRGERNVLDAVRRCFASLFTDRAISYREIKGFDHMTVALSVGVQRMVRSDKASAGVMFSIDTETGFPNVVLINAAWGLGEYVVQGAVDPDECVVFKPLLAESRLSPIIEKSLGRKQRKLVYATGRYPTRGVNTSLKERRTFALSDKETLKLARWATAIEAHYGCPMDIEWAKDGNTGELFVVQARPETVQSRRVAASLKTYRFKAPGKPIVSGSAIGSAISAGPVCRLKSAREAARFPDGAVLVTEMTDPDWGPIMKRAAAIVTAHGGRTSHAAIVSRELGLPAIVGATGATTLLHDGADVTVSCAEGDRGYVYAGRVDFREEELSLKRIPKTHTEVMLNMADPAAAFRWWKLPADGIGLARMEFIVSNHIQIHPMALARFHAVKDLKARRAIETLTRDYARKESYFVDRLAQGVARLAASRWPAPVIVRMSDFKTNEYAKLIGGAAFEPREPNPMIGWRGASRYYSEGYREGFALECQAIRKVREEMGLSNVIVMIPFCRTLREADLVLKEMAKNGLKRGRNGLKVYVMCEIPSNVILAEQFAERFDGFSIGSNDLTQLTLGVDRDSTLLAHVFDEEDQAVKTLIRNVIAAAHRKGVHIGLCGQAPSDRPGFAAFLVESEIDSVSVTPDSFFAVKQHIAAAERRIRTKNRAGDRTRSLRRRD